MMTDEEVFTLEFKKLIYRGVIKQVEALGRKVATNEITVKEAIIEIEKIQAAHKWGNQCTDT